MAEVKRQTGYYWIRVNGGEHEVAFFQAAQPGGLGDWKRCGTDLDLEEGSPLVSVVSLPVEHLPTRRLRVMYVTVRPIADRIVPLGTPLPDVGEHIELGDLGRFRVLARTWDWNVGTGEPLDVGVALTVREV